jgi:FKBP-type peptidyl-prolyl cis-trans isomerase
MLSKFELLGMSASVVCMAAALYLIQVETSLLTGTEKVAQTAQLAESGLVVVGDGEDVNRERASALFEASDTRGNLKKLVIDDIMIGTGDAVVAGDTVVVHYIGTLQNGTEFDNSNKRGEPFSFKVGAGRVIKGWEEGLLGMKVGGKRILVIPPDMAYGSQAIGPIPANSTLVFAIELLEIKK